MESNLNVSEFKDLLKSKTQVGNPKIKLSIFTMFTGVGESSKTFFGVFDDKSFYITANFGFFQRNSTPFILKGSYKSFDGKLRVEYLLEPRFKYQKVWWFFVAVFGFSTFNYILFSKRNSIDTDLFYIINSVLIFMISYGLWRISRSRKRLENNFIKIFKLSN